MCIGLYHGGRKRQKKGDHRSRLGEHVLGHHVGRCGNTAQIGEPWFAGRGEPDQWLTVLCDRISLSYLAFDGVSDKLNQRHRIHKPLLAKPTREPGWSLSEAAHRAPTVQG